MTYSVWVWSTGLQLHSFFKLVSKLAAIALINSLDDLMLSPGGFVEAENPPRAWAAARVPEPKIRFYYRKIETAAGNYTLKSWYQNARYRFSAVNAQASDASSRFLKFGAAKTCLGLTQKLGFSTKEDRFSHQQEYTNPETGNFFVSVFLSSRSQIAILCKHSASKLTNY